MTHYLGLMSGTSVDGVDAVAINVVFSKGSARIKIIGHTHEPYPDILKKRLMSLTADKNRIGDIAELNVTVAEIFGSAVIRLMKKRSVAGIKVKAIGSHGQTVCHAPERNATLRIGDPAVIARRAGIPVWSDFRSADMANTGQGAPLAPIIHLPMFASPDKNVCVVNIGGIANITHIPAGSDSLADLTAWDTGPGNMLIDLAVRKSGMGDFDDGGLIGADGKVDETLLRKFLEHPYFYITPPKSTGRELFGETFIKWARKNNRIRWNKNLVTTLTELTACSITRDITKLKPRVDRLIVCGGGAKNHYLVKRLQEMSPDVEALTSDHLKIPCDAIEPALMALLAFYADHGVRLDLSSITGSKNRSVLLGSLTPV